MRFKVQLSCGHGCDETVECWAVFARIDIGVEKAFTEEISSLDLPDGWQVHRTYREDSEWYSCPKHNNGNGKREA